MKLQLVDFPHGLNPHSLFLHALYNVSWELLTPGGIPFPSL